MICRRWTTIANVAESRPYGFATAKRTRFSQETRSSRSRTARPRAPRNVAQIVDVIGEKGVGVVQGQVADLQLAASRAQADPAKAAFVYEHKTADLFIAAAKMGALAAGGSQEDVEALGRFALHLGLAFQYQDDLLDGDGAFSREKTQALAEESTAAALEALDGLRGDTSPLRALASRLLGRTN